MFANSSYYKQTLEKVGARNVSVQLLPFLHLIKTNVRLTFRPPRGFFEHRDHIDCDYLNGSK